MSRTRPDGKVLMDGELWEGCQRRPVVDGAPLDQERLGTWYGHLCMISALEAVDEGIEGCLRRIRGTVAVFLGEIFLQPSRAAVQLTPAVSLDSGSPVRAGVKSGTGSEMIASGRGSVGPVGKLQANQMN